MEPFKCPACNAPLDLSEGNAILFCPHCGVKLPQQQDSLDKLLAHKERTQKFKEEVRQRKVQEKVDEKSREFKKTLLLVLGIFAIIFALGFVVFLGVRGENNSEEELKALVAEIQTDLEAENYDIALFKAEQLYWPHSDINGQIRWNRQRKELIKVIKDAKKHSGK